MIEYDKSIFKIVNELFKLPDVIEYVAHHGLHIVNHQVCEDGEPFDFCISSISRPRRESKVVKESDANLLVGLKAINKNLMGTIIDGMYRKHIDSDHVGPIIPGEFNE